MPALVDQKNIDTVVCFFFCITWLLFTLIQETSDHLLSWIPSSTCVVSMLQPLASFESLFFYCFFASFLFFKKILLYRILPSSYTFVTYSAFEAVYYSHFHSASQAWHIYLSSTTSHSCFYVYVSSLSLFFISHFPNYALHPSPLPKKKAKTSHQKGYFFWNVTLTFFFPVILYFVETSLSFFHSYQAFVYLQ